MAWPVLTDEQHESKFWSLVDKSGDCWLWQGCRLPKGYGIIQIRWRKTLAHRRSFEYVNGAIPQGMCVCHTCDNPPCVNPAHLFLGTYQDNNRDTIAKGRRRPNPQKGEAHHKARLTEEDVAQIMSLKGVVPQKILAKRYGVGKSTVAHIHRGATWKHVTEAA